MTALTCGFPIAPSCGCRICYRMLLVDNVCFCAMACRACTVAEFRLVRMRNLVWTRRRRRRAAPLSNYQSCLSNGLLFSVQYRASGAVVTPWTV